MSTAISPCSASHCGALSEAINATCKQEGWQVNHLVTVCDPNTGKCCTCTCSCLAFGTPVLIPGGQRKVIEEFKLGDLVVAFDPDASSEDREVAFSNGTAADSVQPEMAYVDFTLSDGSTTTVVVTLDHTFLRPDGKLIRASMLQPGTELVLADGTSTNVGSFNVKGYTGGVWNIATSTGRPDSLDGHLIDTSGILSGDFAVQLYYHDFAEQGLAARHDELPEATTSGHDAAAGAGRLAAAWPSPPTIGVVEFLAGTRNRINTLAGGGSPRGSVLLNDDHAAVLEVAAGVQGFLTRAQADEVFAKFPPTSERAANDLTLAIWLHTSFHGFYPDVTFIIDAPNRGANAFAFNLGDRPYVLVQGGLIRAINVKWQALALILGYSIARFTGGAPYGTDALTCKPRADYGAVGILANVFYPLYESMIFDAYNQVKELFAGIEDKADGPVSGCHPTDLGCRIETYAAAMQYLSLPRCAGGPKPPLLEVTGAAAETDAAVEVSFNEVVNVAIAEEPANYAFEPGLEATAATVTSSGISVVVAGEFEPQTEYKVTVSNVQSVAGYPLAPKKDRADFVTP